MALRRTLSSITSLITKPQLAESSSWLVGHATEFLGGQSTFSQTLSLSLFKSATASASRYNFTTSAATSISPSTPIETAATSGNEGVESIEEIRSRIFGTHIGNGLRSGRKVLKGKLLGPVMMSYYPPDPVRGDPFMLDVAAEKAKLKLDRLKRRGKAPPKKGSGKRSKK